MINDIHLQNFRSYRDATFEFSDGVNIIVGPNASGKTNLLEALLMLAAGRSYRGRDRDLIRLGAESARAEAHTGDGLARIMHLQTIAGGPRPVKQFKIKDQTLNRLGSASRLPVVVFEPNDLRLLAGAPDKRRQYLDDLNEQTVAGFSTTRRQYWRALMQRNALLKNSHKNNQSQLFVWNLRLSELGEQLAGARHKLTREINQKISLVYQSLASRDDQIKARYNPALPLDNYASAMIHQLEINQDLDRLRGFTCTGPQREDWQILINGRPSGETASRGESRSIILALKIIELQIISQAHNLTPLLLLDDVFSELDGARRQALTKQLKPYQTFITTTDADVVLKHFTDQANIIPL
ncbi:MAG: DNA replication/repair protein RecF [Candidatus Saccharimonadales bacterium]